MSNNTEETKKKSKPGKYAKDDNRGRNVFVGIISIIAIIIIILLLLKCCGSNSDGDPTLPTIGDFDITDNTQGTTAPDETSDTPMIIFTGRGEYYVTNDSPNIELRNSEKNKELGADMVFTVIDVKTNEIIARTSKVSPGKYVYVNMLNYYPDPGTYNIVVQIGVTDKNGNSLNGMNQEAVVYVVNN